MDKLWFIGETVTDKQGAARINQPFRKVFGLTQYAEYTCDFLRQDASMGNLFLDPKRQEL